MELQAILDPNKIPEFLESDQRHFNMTLKLVNHTYPDLEMTVYESAGFFVDQMLGLRDVTIQTALLTVVSMTVVCAIFMRSVINVVTATASMTSITIGVIGIMSNMGFDLDPAVMVSFLMTIGMSVDYIAHVAYHIQSKFKTVNSKGEARSIVIDINKKVDHTVQSVGLPMLYAGLSFVWFHYYFYK
ncbi:MMPL [Parelaphostrongylus tenuis]|uniref:MMPL n=1 Tax=Parelaphostrongylus tenuis TaxID=148309 RepID=A0AAD5QTU9_PARTN|nr:MMPL [Parelaphostrongylus tenuis]